MAIGLFVATLILWALILKYRVHVTIAWDGGTTRTTKRRTAKPARTISKPAPENIQERDIASALQNLGCDRAKAKAIAQLEAAKGGDFDSMLKRALLAAA